MKIKVREDFSSLVDWRIEVWTDTKKLYRDVYGEEEWRHKYFLNRAFRSRINEMEARNER